MSTDVTPAVSTLSQRIAEEIRSWMGRRRLSGASLARALNVSPAWVSYRLTGVQEIGVNELERIAEVLDVDVIDLMPVREGRLVTHAGASRRQTTVPKIGSLTSRTKRATSGRPHGRTSAIPPLATSDRRVSRLVATAA